MGIALFLVVFLPSSGSSGAEPLSEDAYFAQLGESMDDLQLRFAEVPLSVYAITGGNAGADAESRNATARGLRELSASADEFRRNLAALPPPRQFSDAHGDLVDASGAMGTLFNEIADQVAGDQPFEDVEGDLLGLLDSGPMTGFLAACAELEGLSGGRFDANCDS